MAITSTQSKAPGSVSNVATGSYITTSAAAAFTITCGFKPRYVRVVNQTSGDAIEWFYGMTAAHGIKRVAAGTNAATTSLGITVAEHGFTVGLDLDINVINEQLRWLAIG
jgi:hypothetical protein